MPRRLLALRAKGSADALEELHPRQLLLECASPSPDDRVVGPSSQLADEVAAAALRHDAVLLDRHGAVCLGAWLEDAFCKLETMERLATIMKPRATSAGSRTSRRTRPCTSGGWASTATAGRPRRSRRRTRRWPICPRRAAPARGAATRAPRGSRRQRVFRSRG